MKQTAQNLYLKARIEAKSGNKAAAIADAEAAIKAAGPNDKELVGEIQKSIEDWKK